MIFRPAASSALIAVILISGCATVPPPIEERLSPGEFQAITAWRGGKYMEASKAFMQQARKMSDPGLARDSSSAARHGGKIREAEGARQFARSLTPDGGTRWDILSVSRLFLAAGEPSRAIQELDKPESAWEHLTRGQALRRVGKHIQAVDEFRAAISAESGLSLAEQELGETFEALGQAEEAIRSYETALAMDRTQVHLQLRLARLENASGRKKAAFDRYTKYLVMDPSNAEASLGKSLLARADASLPEAEAMENLGKARVWAEFKAATANPLPPIPLSPIAIGIVPSASSFRIKSSSGFSIMSGGKPAGNVEANVELAGEIRDGKLVLSWSTSSVGAPEGILLVPAAPDSCFALFNVHVAPGFFWSEMETRSYRGSLEVRMSGNKLALINRVSLEEYLLSCVPAEMPASWPINALKAQAVAARSETLSKLGRHRAEGYDICSEQHCAVYRGVGNEQMNSTRAVLESRGEVISAGDKPVAAVYSDNCGGWGSTPEEVWGSPLPGLKAVCDLRNAVTDGWERVTVSPDIRDRFLFERPDTWCRQADRPLSNNRWTRSYLSSELESLVNRRYKVGKLKRIGILSYTREGRVTAVEVEGDAGKQVIKRDSIRSALGGLRSNMFTVEALPAPGGKESQYIFIGAGWGHGVGLCQTGARGLALAGKRYREILSHYYPGAVRKKLY